MAKVRQIVGLVAWVAVSLLAGVLGSTATASSVSTWYATELIKPDWTPPGWLFGPVWTTLYILMGLAAWRVWRHDGFAAARVPLCLFLGQLALNAAWSFLFFGLRRPDLAMVELVLLWLAIVATSLAFLRRDRAAFFLMLPYLTWTTFAATLNFAIWRLNA
jgi:tryptophan-rich sensory protein